MISVEKALRRRGGLLPGLWPVRASLVLLLVVAQSFAASGAAPEGPLATAPPLAIAALFATIGFSAARGAAGATWRAVMWRRLRIALPPYVLVVIAAPFLLGPLVTDRGLRSYGADLDTYAYLLNLLGAPHYALPGVFEFNNVADVVNEIVWMAPFYLLVLAAVALRPARPWIRWIPGALAIALMLGALVADATDLLPENSRDLTVMALRGDGAAALVGGLLGAAAFHARRWLPEDWRVAAAAALLVLVDLRIGGGDGPAGSVLRVAASVPSAYLAVFLMLQNLPFAATGRALAPYLPGTLLVSFPVQQVAIQYGPKAQQPVVNLALSLPPALLLALLYWHLVGRRLAPATVQGETVQATGRRSLRRSLQAIRRTPKQAMIGYAAGGVMLLIVFLALLWMLYIAMQPDLGDM